MAIIFFVKASEILKMLPQHSIPFFKTAVPNLFPPGTDFVEDTCSMAPGLRGWFQDESSTLHVLCTLFLI